MLRENLHTLVSGALGVTTLVALSAIAMAQPPAVTPMTPEMNPTYNFTRPDADYIRKEVMIPMRDGVKLVTVIAMYKGANNAPILLTRTVYNAGRATSRMAQPAPRRHPAGDGRRVRQRRLYPRLSGRRAAATNPRASSS